MWTRDDSAAPKVIFTPAVGDAHAGVRRVVYDPNAPADKRVTAELAYWYQEGETAEDIAAQLGIV